jgi:hypothetical protein
MDVSKVLAEELFWWVDWLKRVAWSLTLGMGSGLLFDELMQFLMGDDPLFLLVIVVVGASVIGFHLDSIISSSTGRPTQPNTAAGGA